MFIAALLTTARGGTAQEPSSPAAQQPRRGQANVGYIQGTSFDLKTEDKLAHATRRMNLEDINEKSPLQGHTLHDPPA